MTIDERLILTLGGLQYQVIKLSQQVEQLKAEKAQLEAAAAAAQKPSEGK